jgi:hypothetical protein
MQTQAHNKTPTEFILYILHLLVDFNQARSEQRSVSYIVGTCKWTLAHSN